MENKIRKISYLKWAVAMLLGLFCTMAMAQQDVQHTQYMYNTVTVNPAYAGSRGHLSMAALYRAQWVGLDGAPETQTLNMHTPVGYRGVGLGVSFLNDVIGPTSETYFDVDFSYTIKVGEEQKLSFGLKGSAHLLDVNFSVLETGDFGSGGLPPNIDNRFSPNVGAGIYYHTQKFYAGLSIPRMLETEHFDSGEAPSTIRERMTAYFILGNVWDLNPYLKFKPTILAKATTGAPLQLDFSGNLMFNEKFVLGAAYRWDAAFSGMLGFNISNQFFIGLAYDREITDLGATTFNDGSFEVIFRFDLFQSVGNIKSPRFF